jgi:uncharacterized sulfatase
MPNILLITSDQQHWNTLGVLNPEIRTPNLDRLAGEGTLFQRAYCPNPTCTPTRASMITGKYPSQHGSFSLGMKLAEDEPTVGDVFQQAGYRTALVGKAHFQPLRGSEEYASLEAYPVLQDLDFWRGFHGPFYGFEHVELARNHADEAHVGQHYAIWMEENGLSDWQQYFQPPTGTNADQKHKWRLPERYHYNTWIAERTNALLEQYSTANESFFLWASFFDPHPPYLIPEPWDRMYDPAEITVPTGTPGEHEQNPVTFQMTQQEAPDFGPWKEPDGNAMHGFHSHLHDRDALARDIAVYYGMVSCMDKHIGDILDRLDALGLADDTLVVFTSDHGHFYGQHGLIAKGPFHYEDVIRVPYIVRQPGKVPAERQSDALQTLVDLPVSFLAACDVAVPVGMTGVDQTPVWYGQAEAMRDHVLVEHHHQPTTIHVKTYVDARYKLTVHCYREYGELFDLVDDPGEIHNRWSDPAYADLKAELVYKLLLAEIAREEPLDETTAALPQKSTAMYSKTFFDGNWEITVDPANDRFTLYHLHSDPDRERNVWDDPAFARTRAQMVLGLQFARMAAEPMWMPRIAGA